MGSPTPTSAPSTLRPDLASLMEFDVAADRQGFIGYKFAPATEVSLQSDNVGKIPLEQLLQNADVTRADSGGYRRSGVKFSTWSYATQEYGREGILSRRLVAKYKHLIDAETVVANRERDVVLREAEKRLAALLFNTSTWTGSSLTTSVSTPWSTVATAVPISDVDAAKVKVFNGTGLWPNAVVMSYPVFMNVRRCATVIDRVQSAGAGQASKATDITPQTLAQIFDVDYVLVAKCAKNTANENATRSLSQIWSTSYVAVARIATTTDPQEPCVARTFHWSEDGSQLGGTVEKYYSEETRADIIRVRHDVDEVVMYKECQHLLSNIT